MTSEEGENMADTDGEKIEHGGVIVRDIVEEMRTSYLNYSMSVIVGRALPDARDGLKPVHRRILHAMNEGGYVAGKPYRKSARIVGDVMGKYHPHGDSSVYDSMVRMAQSFSLRYPMIDGQGNFGSIDGDSAAAMRYTESRTTRFAMEMLEDIDKETVDMVENYDGSLEEPSVLPSRVPNLLVNGSSGIAVGMATNMPPHNLGEVIEGMIKLMEDPEIDTLGLMECVKAPDFPTGATIYGTLGVYEAYDTGRGKITMRAKADIEGREGGRSRIVVTEIPYMVNKSNMLIKIAEHVKNKVFVGISEIRDESDKDGLRVVFELKRDAIPEVVLNRLYKHSDLQSTFGIINLTVLDGQPKVLSLKELMTVFLEHRRTVIRRSTTYDLKKARERLHIVEGLIIALDNIDRIIKLIRSSKDGEGARMALMEGFDLSEIQARAILDMKLQKLTSLEGDSIKKEGENLKLSIADLEDILANIHRVNEIIQKELMDLKERYGDERRSRIEENAEEIDLEDLIHKRDVLITITNTGYIKRIDLDTYRAQHRGGKGLRGMATKEEDFVVDMFPSSTHDHILFFTSRGRVFWLKGYNIPVGSRQSRGKALINLLPNLEEGEELLSNLKVTEFSEDKYLIFVTRKGRIKRTSLPAYSRPRSTGIRAIILNEGDELVQTAICGEDDEIVLGTSMGMANRFLVRDVRAMGRNTAGVRGMRLKNKGDHIVSMAVVPGSNEVADQDDEHEDPEGEELEEDESGRGPKLITITENGYGKRAYAYKYRLTRRGSSGVINIHRNYLGDTGNVVALMVEHAGSEVMLITQKGMVIRTPISTIRLVNRAGKGVIVMRMVEGDTVMGVAQVNPIEESPDLQDIDETVVSSNPQGGDLEDVGPEKSDGSGDAGEEPKEVVEDGDPDIEKPEKITEDGDPDA